MVKEIRNPRVSLVAVLATGLAMLLWYASSWRHSDELRVVRSSDGRVRLSGAAMLRSLASPHSLASDKDNINGEYSDNMDGVVHPHLLSTAVSAYANASALNPDTDETTIIVFNLFKGPVANLAAQIAKACSQTTAVTSVWVLSFDSPMAPEYRDTVARANSDSTSSCKERGILVTFTESDFNYKFHGRFLLAPMASSISKYLMVVDDDVVMTTTMVQEFIQHMKVKPRLLGTAGQTRSPQPAIEPGWHDFKSPQVQNSRTERGDQPAVDYLCNIWFLKTSWVITLFSRDHPLTYYTGEDIHLSFVLRKYLGIRSTVVKLGPEHAGVQVMKIAKKGHSANHEKRVADVRNDMFRLNLARGFIPTLGGVPVGSLVFVQSERVAWAVVAEVTTKGSSSVFRRAVGVLPQCMLFTGREESLEKVLSLHQAALAFSRMAGCELYLKPKWGEFLFFPASILMPKFEHENLMQDFNRVQYAT
ncbi:hypothetical protein BC830DRAFT_1127594 [Chytriomyces sp. MP71]|nr:hypothetical protein BC830DRAFT_1127594 [Chytriomyces sp. MP71]